MCQPRDMVSIEKGSPERFGYSWDRYPDIVAEHEEQFIRWTQPLCKEDWRGALFLDAGCGIGRNSYWPLRYGATGGVLIDVDERSLARARANLASFPNVRIYHHSIYDTVGSNAFDIVFSIGVVHHLEHPELAVKRLVEAAKPGGRVLLWLYGRENNGWIIRFADPIRKMLFSRMPLWQVHALSWPATAALWVVLRIGAGRTEYFRLLRSFAFRHVRAIVFDHMIPRIARYYRRADAEGLLRGAGLVDLESVWVNQMSWAVSGRKPLAEEILRQ
jgi:SAM-dependent methyltransferase